MRNEVRDVAGMEVNQHIWSNQYYFLHIVYMELYIDNRVIEISIWHHEIWYRHFRQVKVQGKDNPSRMSHIPVHKTSSYLSSRTELIHDNHFYVSVLWKGCCVAVWGRTPNPEPYIFSLGILRCILMKSEIYITKLVYLSLKVWWVGGEGWGRVVSFRLLMSCRYTQTTPHLKYLYKTVSQNDCREENTGTSCMKIRLELWLCAVLYIYYSVARKTSWKPKRYDRVKNGGSTEPMEPPLDSSLCLFGCYETMGVDH